MKESVGTSCALRGSISDQSSNENDSQVFLDADCSIPHVHDILTPVG